MAMTATDRHQLLYVFGPVGRHRDMLSATDKKRKEAFDEAVQGRLLMEHAKIVNIPHGMKKDFNYFWKIF